MEDRFFFFFFFVEINRSKLLIREREREFEESWLDVGPGFYTVLNRIFKKVLLYVTEYCYI